MKHIKSLKTKKMCINDGNCGECHTSCQSARKTLIAVVNQTCEKKLS